MGVRFDNEVDESKCKPSRKKCISLTIVFLLSVIVVFSTIISMVRDRCTLVNCNEVEHYNKKMTVYIDASAQTPLYTLKSLAKYYASCKIVQYVHVAVDDNRKDLKENDLSSGDTTIFLKKKNAVAFAPLQSNYTDAIYSTSTDLKVSCSDLNLAYEIWAGNKQNMVGFLPRLFLRGNNGLSYSRKLRSFSSLRYNVIASRAAIFNHKYFKKFQEAMRNPSLATLRVSECQDILIQFLVAMESKLSPVFVKGHLKFLRDYDKGSYLIEHDQCFNKLVDIYGINPLTESQLVVDYASRLYQPSTLWEFISSDLWKS